MRTRSHTIHAVAGAVLLATTLIVGLGSPARANPAQGWITGIGVPLNIDWFGEGELSRTRYARSNATGLWQAILWADQAKKLNGSTFTVNDIDCEFGPNTEAATKDWQRQRGLTADGRVGSNTFTKASANLVSGPVSGSGRYIYYLGKDGGTVLRFYRYDGSNSFSYAGRWAGTYFTYHQRSTDCGGDPSI